MPVTENVIRLLGRYSEGLRLAAEHGPRSGIVYEYAYRNTPHGSGALGRLIDRTFLHLSTWDGLRQRVHTTKELVVEVLTRRRALGLPTTVLDVASGTAPYLRELARETAGDDVCIICHDRDPRQVMHGRQLAEADSLKRFTFAVGDATDQASYLTSQDPDIVLAVDLFPWFHSDEAVRTTMRLAFEYLTRGGCFICSTLARPAAGMAHWDADAFGLRRAARLPETIANWLSIAGFMHVEQRFSQPDAVALIAWKP